ncbi:glutathione S-transferase family protein [Paraburkholderia sp. BL25I1N1]|uniref:glutathione S-transferase family protein n=1 Tax=Paraburkholderia sp. BL25I1N1 TaxID=1938804 RepID=UPI000D06B8ED|nr:glutathione S-transferase family protein [Paraburkholderia sp. BL25I1N1]PRX96439.1 glutathione S-transferase [Paraburkholderia sp. BL25I1N1]
MITVYQFSTSPFCAKVRKILGYKGLHYEIVEVPRDKVAEFKDVSPTGKFPAIRNDGDVVWDSTDIAYYLDAAFPERAVIPADAHDRAIVHIIEEWADESLYFYEVLMRIGWPQNVERVVDEFAATMPNVDRQALPALLVEKGSAIATAQGIGRKPQEQVVQDAKRHADALDALLQKQLWLVGEKISLADIAVSVQVEALLYAREFSDYVKPKGKIAEWLKRVNAAAPDKQRMAA